jgi:hypothetical protein
MSEGPKIVIMKADTIALALSGQAKGLTYMSAEDQELCLYHRWRSGTGGYVVRSARKCEGRGRGSVFLHREVMKRVLGRELGPTEQVDHKNHLKNDNRRENLRLCTRAENLRNRQTFRNNRTGFKGVRLVERGKYSARIMANGRNYNLGLFLTAEEASKAYQLRAVELHGQFASHLC